jgi:tape measure domain-containing protein
MARNRIEELLVQLKFEGSEELRKIASGFRDLGRATTLTDTQIQSARRQINDYAKSLNNSEQALKGQIQALQTLRTQATVGGNVYSQLANDVTRLSKTLKGLEEDYKAVGRASEQTDRQIANQFPARRPEAFRVQIAALRRELDGLSVSARAYGDQLTQITIRETAFGRAQARQGVIAGAQAVGAPLIGSMTPQQELPNTTAALRLRLTELRDDLQNTDYALNDYKNTLKEIEVVQKELDRVIGDANKTRKEEIRDRIANLKAINEENAALRQQSAVAGSIARNRAGQAATAGRGLSGAMFGPQAPSEMFRSIGAIIDQPALNTAELMGRTYGEVAQQIRSVAASSDGSINSLQRQRAAWQQLRTTISPLSADYGKAAKEADRAMAAIDRQVQRMQARRRMSAMEATQAAGAVISGGIFGGPEGAAGGIAVGTVVGGVPGAFAGAAIGAQFGMIRQSLGQMAAFTAEIDKQRIALRNVVGTQAEYERSLQFIDATSRRLAIPQDQLNKQFTQLSASVIGAGGNVDAAKLAFEGIAAGIRGTGGNLSDMQSALLATSQVFSKGKVSAEELRQQIGERLPGAFTIFAQSIGKTPQELDKMLEKGEVGLNDFMTFVQALSQRYGASANEIAASSQSAGDRMATTFARIREAVGRELQPVGAQFQEAFATAFAENEQAIVDFAKSIATAAKVVADNAGLIAESLKVLLGFGAIAAAIPLATSVAATFAKVSLAIASMGGAASVAGLAVKGLIASLLAVSPFGWIAAGVVGLGLLGKAVYDNNEIFKNWVDNIGGVVAGDFRNSMDAMAGDAESATNRISGAFEGLGQNTSSVGNFIQQVFDDLFGFVSQSGASSASQVDNSWADAMNNIGANTSAAFDGLTEMLANWWEALPAPLRNILGGNTASALAGAAQYAAGASSRAAQGGPAGSFADTGGYGRYGAPAQQMSFKHDPFNFDFGSPGLAVSKRRRREGSQGAREPCS